MYTSSASGNSHPSLYNIIICTIKSVKYVISISAGVVHVLAASFIHLHSTDLVTEGGESAVILRHSSDSATPARAPGAEQGIPGLFQRE